MRTGDKMLSCSGQCDSAECKLKGGRFHSRSGHVPGVQVQSLVWVPTEGNHSMFLSHVDVSLSFSLPFPLSKIKDGIKKHSPKS